MSREKTTDPTLAASDMAYLADMRAAQLVEATPRTTWALYLILIVMLAGLGWASLTRVDEVTRADARVIPDGREQIIASLEGGILRELKVTEGMQVEAGQELALLDPTRVESLQNEGQLKRLALQATLSRLTAEANERELAFTPEVAAVRTLQDGETEVFNARRRSLQEAVSANALSIDLLGRELHLAQTMSAKGLMSEVEVMRLRRQVNDLKLANQDRVNKFKQDASTELVRVQNELTQLDEQLVGRADVLRRTVLTSPVKGIVKNIRANTLGGVVAAGGPIMEIVPLGSRILIEARVKPSEIGFMRVGQTAQVKLKAFDYTLYGGLEGVVEYISPDALGDVERPNAPDSTYYRALVRAERSDLSAQGAPLTVLPGMTALVEVRTGERSILSYLLRPMLKSTEAFRERG